MKLIFWMLLAAFLGAAENAAENVAENLAENVAGIAAEANFSCADGLSFSGTGCPPDTCEICLPMYLSGQNCSPLLDTGKGYCIMHITLIHEFCV